MKDYPERMSQAKRIIIQLEGRIKELEQQLAEQVAYGEYLCTRIPRGKTLESNPSQALVNQMKAEAVREYGEHLSHAEDRLTPEDYAKQLGGR